MPVLRHLALVLALLTVSRPLGAAPATLPQPLGPVSRVVREERGVQLICADGSSVTCTVLSADLVRVQAQFADQPAGPATAWAIARTDWPAVPWSLSEDTASLTLATAELEVVVQRQPVRISFREAATHRVINADREPMARDAATGQVVVAKKLGLEEHFYGLGEKAARLDRRRGRFTMWNSDTPGYVESTDPIYQSIPFYLGMEGGRAYGIFHDNSFRSTFDFGQTGQDATIFSAEGGEVDYYFFGGPSLRKILDRYTELTGRMPLPPLWALGNQQSRYSYYPDAQVEQIAALYRKHDLPLDVLYLDIHYMNGYRVFTWDPVRFPDPSGLCARLGAQGVKIVTIVDPGVKLQPPAAPAQASLTGPELAAQTERYYVHDEGVAGDHFLRRRDGSLYVGEVWPGPSLFVDYTRPESRRWWGDLHRALLNHGVAGIWTDMNEPSDFVDKTGATQADVVFHDGGARSLYARHRNLFALNMARATYEGLARLQPDRRPFVITRAGYAGIQRFATVWTGDNNATWESLALNLPMFASLGLSGEAFVGADVPGFIGRASPELLVRSYQVAFLAPLLRNHAAIDNYDHEPWRFGPVYTDIIRKYLQLRYRLMPFLYTTLEEAHRTGTPLFRPLVLNFQDDDNTATLDDQFMVGDALLVAPVLQAGQRVRDVYLPAGRWYDFWSGRPVEGGRLLGVEAPLDRLPLFVRGGCIVPSTVAMLHVAERPWDPLRFDIYPDTAGAALGALYEDDGVSPAYRSGAFRRTSVTSTHTSKGIRIALAAPVGPYQPPARTYEFVVHGAGACTEVRLDGRPLGRRAAPAAAATWFTDAETLTVRLPDDNRAHLIELR
ncbi:MAG TPA: TIM-barrel domain-containing protein [Opitutaceae bacterium]|nr:TIM-barrel domain-containing protein [Opitutaceae bacterium]